MFSCCFCVSDALTLFINQRLVLNRERKVNLNFFPGVTHSGFQIKYICQLNPETGGWDDLTLTASFWFSGTSGLG